MIPPLDLKAAATELQPELEAVFRRFLESGRYVLGPETDAFEEEYAAYCRADHCVGVSSGLDALHLALRAAGIGAGDEVIVASNTYIATWLAVTHAGAAVVPAEPDPATHNLDPDCISACITPRTKAVLATSLYGQPVDYDRIRQITDSSGLLFLTDSAQANGACFGDRPVGGLADMECHSFYPTKNLGAMGEAGAVTTSNPEFARRIRLLRNYGSEQRYQHQTPGFNCRIDELQAGLLRVRLRYLDDWNARRRTIASVYSESLAACSDLTLPHEADGTTHAWHQYVIRSDRRDQLQQDLKENGIITLIHYPVPPHQSEAYRFAGFPSDQFPIANELAASVLSLPMSPHLAKDDALQVAETILRVIRQRDDDRKSEYRAA